MKAPEPSSTEEEMDCHLAMELDEKLKKLIPNIATLSKTREI